MTNIGRQGAALAIVVAGVAALAGCGGTSGVVTQTVTVTTHEHHAAVHRLHHHRQSARQTVGTTTSAEPASTSAEPAYTACDQNISVRANTTTCSFGENVFYEYWRSGEATTIRAYSPDTHASYSLTCTPGEGAVVCTTATNAVVRFSQAAVDAYTQSQADAYANAADLGPQEPASGVSGDSGQGASGASSDSDTGGFCTTHECIPSFYQGHGSIVQCNDGQWSHSGGLAGACSYHGGER